MCIGGSDIIQSNELLLSVTLLEVGSIDEEEEEEEEEEDEMEEEEEDEEGKEEVEHVESAFEV